VGAGEACLEKRGVLHNDRSLPAKRLNRLEILRHDTLTGIALGRPPAQHVYDLAVDIDSIPDHTVFAWRSSGSD
jgi:hypothetical protein